MRTLVDGEVAVVEIDVGEPELPSEPGPRLARTLAEQDAAAAKQAKVRRVVGVSLLVVGLLVAALAARSVLTGDDTTEQRVGRLTASKLGDEATATTTTRKGGGSTKVSSATTPPKTGAGNTGDTGGDQPSGGTDAAPAWPTAVSGRPPALGRQGEPPPADAGDLEDGYYLWQDFNGWHLWLVGGSDADQVSITADSEVAKADPAGGDVSIDRSGNAFTFSRGSAGAEVVGVDFNPGYYAKTFVVTVDGDLPLHIGARRWKAPAYYGVQKSTANA